MGAPVQLEGEPAEIAQLVELLTTNAVRVEHVHRWRIGDADDQGVQRGECWCGASKDFAPWNGMNEARASTSSLGLGGATHDAEKAKASAERRGGKRGRELQITHRTCKHCGQAGHDRRTCPQLVAA